MLDTSPQDREDEPATRPKDFTAFLRIIEDVGTMCDVYLQRKDLEGERHCLANGSRHPPLVKVTRYVCANSPLPVQGRNCL